MRSVFTLFVPLAFLGASCAAPPPPPPPPGTNVDLIIQSIEVGDPIPLPDGTQFALPLQIIVRNREQGFIKPSQSFDITASVSRVDDPLNPLPANAPSASLVFDRPVTMLSATYPSPKTFSMNGPINGKTNVAVSRTAYVTALQRKTTYDLEVVVDWCDSWPSGNCQISETIETNNSKTVQVSIP